MRPSASSHTRVMIAVSAAAWSKGRAGSCDRHQPRACAKRAARGKTCGTRLREPAGEDHGMTARIFMSFDAWNGECLPPQSRTIGEGFGRDRRQDMFRDSDIRYDSAAAMDAARQQQVPRLAAKKCDGACGDYSGATDLPAGAVDAGGNIHGEDWPFGSPRPFIDTQDQSLSLPIEIAAKARAEERVDRESGRIEIKFLDGEDLAGPILGGKRGVALQAVARAKQSELDGKSRRASRRAATKPSPPLLPGPQKTAMRPWRGTSRVASRATAAPACSISTEPGVPPAMVSRSASVISALVKSSGREVLGSMRKNRGECKEHFAEATPNRRRTAAG